MTLYDKAYWLQHGATYRDEFRPGPRYVAQEAAILDVLAPLAFESVLEVGCGFGRATRVVRDAFRPHEYVATDVSADALDRARQYVGRESAYNGIVFEVLDLDQPWTDEATKYAGRDLVLAAEVLMHRTPEQVIVDAEQLAELATKYILNIDWYEPGAKPVEGCYQHDYAALFAHFGTVARINVPAARQAIWLTTMGAA